MTIDSSKVPKKLQPIYQALIQKTDQLCQDYLDQDYAILARRVAAALARKRPSPLLAGKKQTWVAATIYSLGTINFLYIIT